MCRWCIGAQPGGMAQTTAPHDVVHDLDETYDDDAARERLRTIVPTAIAVVLLFGVIIAGSLALGGLLDFGVWFLAS